MSEKHYKRIIVDSAQRQIVPIPNFALGFPCLDGSEKCRLVIGIFWLNFRIRIFCFRRRQVHGHTRQSV